MKRLLQLAAAVLLTTALAPASAPKPQPENVEWIWQYTPDDTHKDGRENDLAQDLRFVPFLQQFLTAPQTFWGQPLNGRYRSLASTALDHLSVPDKVVAEENRYVSISGCVVHFCAARGLLWIDLNGTHHLVVFAAIDWNKQGRPTTDPAAEYTLWVFPDEPLSLAGPTGHPPAALTKAIGRWAAQPPAPNPPPWLPPPAPLPPAAPTGPPPAALTKAIGRWAAQPLAGSGIVQN